MSTPSSSKRKAPELSTAAAAEPSATSRSVTPPFKPGFKRPVPPLSKTPPNPAGLSETAKSDLFNPLNLTVETSLHDDDEVVDEPPTPANVRSMRKTELHAAVCAGDLAEAERLLEGGHPVEPQEEHGFTPLHNAAALPEKVRSSRSKQYTPHHHTVPSPPPCHHRRRARTLPVRTRALYAHPHPPRCRLRTCSRWPSSRRPKHRAAALTLL